MTSKVPGLRPDGSGIFLVAVCRSYMAFGTILDGR